MSGGSLEIAGLGKSFRAFGKKIVKLRVVIFMFVLVAVYGFIIFKVYTLAGIAPDESAVPSTSKASRAHIDEEVARKIQDLQDNSVSVKSLFDEARQNPFQE